jgi:hypothetical protein
MLMCLVRGLILGTVANSNAPDLSSNALQHTLVVWNGRGYFFVCNSLKISMSGMTAQREVLRAMYSGLVVDRGISVCSFDCHTKGQPAKVSTYPDLDLAVSILYLASSLCQFPAKSASA